MKIEVLVSTMNQQDTALIEKMKLETDAVIINQTDKHEFKEITLNENKIRFYSFNERGVGLSRNSALMRSDADICILADDDINSVFVNNSFVILVCFIFYIYMFIKEIKIWRRKCWRVGF